MWEHPTHPYLGLFPQAFVWPEYQCFSASAYQQCHQIVTSGFAVICWKVSARRSRSPQRSMAASVTNSWSPSSRLVLRKFESSSSQSSRYQTPGRRIRDAEIVGRKLITGRWSHPWQRQEGGDYISSHLACLPACLPDYIIRHNDTQPMPGLGYGDHLTSWAPMLYLYVRSHHDCFFSSVLASK